jgi:hypothetical protein
VIKRVHYPGCNVWCNEHGHWLLSSGPQGEPFSHQDATLPPCDEEREEAGDAGTE